MKKRLPLIIAALFAVWALSALRVPGAKPNEFAFQEFGRLPLVSNGRCQPLDSLGRNALLQIREKQTANLEPWKGASEHPKIISATEWLMAMMMNPELADTWPLIRIDNPDLKGLLALAGNADPDQKFDGKHFAWNAIKTKFPDLQRETRRAAKIDQSLRTPFDQAVIRLSTVARLYMRLQNTLQPQNAKDWPAELASFTKNAVSGVAALSAQQAGQKFDETAMARIMPDLERFEAMAQLEPPMLIPPHHPQRAKDDWSATVEGLTEVARGEPTHFSLLAYAKMAGAYRAGDVAGFNQAVRDYRTALSPAFQTELKKAANEQRFNNFEPFYKAMTLYVIAFIAVLGFWFAPARLEWLRRTAVAIVLVALAIHTGGLLFRMLLEGRPPVTNLYSSAIFIGWGACILGLILEWFWKNSIGLVISSAIGFITLIIAHHLSLTGDTMEMMRAVLDTNFWLATHVVVVTLGYASTFVAGFLALVYIILGVFTKKLSTTVSPGDAPSKQTLNIGKSLAKMVYGIVCFATLFSFVGTVLGGIWADQSWGRFWGWDPKENGALIIVLWNALILHARWGGMVRERGLMNLAIFGNIVTSWSWFGVNMLGIGLHAYGFMDAAFMWLMIFVGSQLLLIGLGLLPLSMWRSFHDSGNRPAAMPPALPV
ncbi:MAG: cytochrome c assembly protein [Chthoniobacteraceae bacterium]|nr:cytochrome c assembly protein [Chthoniobacteraceae bacterium]